ncbi:hypothetical protein, partial [Serratia sp. H1w]|uniref:hypothetical protein n=1 Tax=Serratia sp. H1w TaxID=1397285 RepID=UPI001E4B5F6C
MPADAAACATRLFTTRQPGQLLLCRFPVTRNQRQTMLMVGTGGRQAPGGVLKQDIWMGAQVCGQPFCR